MFAGTEGSERGDQVTDAEITELGDANGWNIAAMARAAGKASGGGGFGRRVRRLRDELGRGPSLEMDAPPSPDLSVEEIIALRKRRFELQHDNAEARKLIAVTVRDRGLLPIGILHHGDPHLDSPGSDLDLLLRHAGLIRETEGLWASSVGDLRDNWIGRLAHLWEQQGMTGSESWKLAEHWIKNEIGPAKWLYLVAGNHDLWTGSGDPLAWISAQSGALYQSSEVRIALKFKGAADVRVNCRHDFAGHSQWNSAHGPLKAVMMGVRDHIAICGHRHVSGYNITKDPETGILCHAIRVATYKRFDRYAQEHGFRDQNVSPCALTTIDPRLPPTHPDLVKLWHDPEEGVAVLKWSRARKKVSA